MPPNEKRPPVETSGRKESCVASREDVDTVGAGQAHRDTFSQRLNAASPPQQYEFALPRRTDDDDRLDRLDREKRVAPFYRRVEAADAERAKSVFKAAQTAVAEGDTAEAGRLLAEWRQLSGARGSN